MRTQLTGAYSANKFELRTEDDSLYFTVEPDQIFRIGNAIGGFWAKPIRYAEQQMLALVRIGGSKLNWSLERIRRNFGKERGTILQPGRGLWAESSGSARRGVWHRIHEDADPIRQTLRSLELPSNLVRTVDEINEEVRSGGQFDRAGACSHWFITDGTVSELALIGGDRWGTRAGRVTGGTYLVSGCDFHREDCRFAHPKVDGVIVTPSANRELVAEIVKTGNR